LPEFPPALINDNYIFHWQLWKGLGTWPMMTWSNPWILWCSLMLCHACQISLCLLRPPGPTLLEMQHTSVSLVI
jgi:hypothetical protein